MATIKPDVAEKLRGIIKSLESITGELPGQAKAAVGFLKSILNKKAKEDLEADEMAQMIRECEVLQEILEGDQIELEGEMDEKSDMLAQFDEILNSLSIDLHNEAVHPHGDHACVCPKCGKEVTVGAGEKCNAQECPECKVAMRAKDTGERRDEKPDDAQTTDAEMCSAPPKKKKPKSLAASKAPLRSSTFRSDARLIEAVPGAGGKVWEAVLIEAGMSANRRFYPHEVLQKAYPLFEGVKAYVDHRVENGKARSERSVRDIAGWFEQVACDDGHITAHFNLSEGQDWLKAMLKNAYESGKDDLIGFSILAEGSTRLDREDSGAYWFVESIDKVHSVDLVTEPAAGGRLAGLLESEQKEVQELMEINTVTREELKAVRPDLFEAEKVSPDVVKAVKDALSALKSVEGDLPAVLKSVMDKLSKMAYAEPGKEPVKEDITEDEAILLVEAELSDKVVNKIKTALRALNSVKKDLPKNILTLLDRLAGNVYGKAKKESVSEEKMEKYDALEERINLAESRSTLRETLVGLDLPEPIKQKIEKRFSGKVFLKEDLDSVIAEEKEVLGKLAEMPESPFIPRVRGMQAESDTIAKAMDGMFSGAAVDGVKPFRSLKEAFAVVKGISVLDVDSPSILSEARGYASVGRLVESLTSGSWAEVMGDSITRALLREYRLPALEDWRQLCSEIGSIKDFRTQERIAVGGYGTLPAVGEGAPYQALTSPGDDKLTWAISKRGGLEDLTMETIINDDLGAVKRIPRSLARAAKVTLYRFVMDLIVNITWATVANGTGIQEGVVNSTSTALSDAALDAAKVIMRDQTAYGEATAFLQLKPKFMLVPNELESTAKKLQTGEFALRATSLPGGSEYVAHTSEINIHRNTFETIVVDYWTGSGLWYLVADPALANTIEIGFLDGKQEPELLTQDQPNVGSVFTADKISYKIRHIYGGVVLDYRSFFRGGS